MTISPAAPEEATPTPLTDAELVFLGDGYRSNMYVHAYFARSLERQLAQAQIEITGLNGIIRVRSDALAQAQARVAESDSNYVRAREFIEQQTARVAELEKFLHSRCMHPDFEYGTTTGPRKAWWEHQTPEGEGWEKNIDEGRNGWDRFEYHEEAYWRRRKPDAAISAGKDK